MQFETLSRFRFIIKDSLQKNAERAYVPQHLIHYLLHHFHLYVACVAQRYALRSSLDCYTYPIATDFRS
jgi:hypothetical protein